MVFIEYKFNYSVVEVNAQVNQTGQGSGRGRGGGRGGLKNILF